ncbi:hypothetical protein CT0861_11227, partial [Colletotrichum tofieldiae]
MKFFRSVTCALLAASQCAMAMPVAEFPDTSVVEYRTLNEAQTVKDVLEKRINCRSILAGIRSIGTSRAVVVFMVWGGDLAAAVCRLRGGQNCEDWALVIKLGFTMIYAMSDNTNGAVPEKRDGELDYTDTMRALWEQKFIDSGLTYDSIEVLPFDPEAAALDKRNGEPKLLGRIYFSGIVDDAGNKHEIIANHFEGNNTVLNLPGLNQATLASRDLSKRVDGAGFKISYTTRGHSLLTRSHQQEMSAMFASSWAIHSEMDSMDDFIGFAETDRHANFYFRIIPELRGFGLNYESVDICG